jgi:hypothetical protein
MEHKNSTTNLHEQFHHIVYRWFVRYNPLYFFSALCVLVGIYLVSQGLNVIEWTSGQLLLTRVVQVYEVLLIAGAALLFRGAKQYRPAVILGIMEVVFLFDCTFRTEVATTLEHSERTVAIAWGIMVVLKLIALAWAFRLKLSATAFVVPVLAAIGIASFPQLFQEHDAIKGTIHLIATWCGIALTVFAYWKRPTILCKLSLDEWGQTVLRRASKAIWLIWVGFYFLHLLIWLNMFEIPVTILHLVSLLLLIPLLSKHEWWVWAGSVNALAIALVNPSTVSLTALAVALVLGWKAWRTQQKRLYVGTILALYIAVWTIGWQQWPLPEFNLWLSLVSAAMLILMAWRLQLPVALLPMLAGVYPIMKFLRSLSGLGWGIILLTIGFIALIVGVAINWSQRSPYSVGSKQ